MPTELVEDATMSEDDAQRKNWMKLLANSPAQRIKSLWSEFSMRDEPFDVIRQPERGLVMVRGRAGSGGDKFNLGEMTVARCAVRLSNGVTGVSYISGRDLDHALIAAKADAMLQSDAHQAAVLVELMGPLKQEEAERADARAAKVASTRVNFFTMVRTREDKK